MSQAKKHPYPLVEVEWLDSASTPGWQFQVNAVPITCWSAGYLVHRDKSSLVVALCCSSARSGNGFGDTMTIPASVVMKLRRLK